MLTVRSWPSVSRLNVIARRIFDLMKGLFSVFGEHRHLVMELTRREVLGRYRGATFGLLWSLISPFLTLGVYTLAFGLILRSRWPGYSGGSMEFALILYLGLIVHGMLAECLNRASGLIVQNANLVTRVVFPLQVLPWTLSLSASFHMCMNMLIFILLSLMIRGYVPWAALMLPLVWLPLVMLSVGVGLFLSALGVYLRDIGQVMGVVATAMLFLSSAIVPIEIVPEGYRPIFYINPLTFIIDQTRAVALAGASPDWMGLGLYLLCAVGFSLAAYAFFMKARRGFADVL